MSDILLKNVNSEIIHPADDYDIVNKYSWTLTDKTKRPDVPYVELVEFEQDLASFFAQISYWSSNAAKFGESQTENPYENLYHAKSTKTKYTIPYFGTYNHNVTQNWEKNSALLDAFGGLGQKLVNAAGLLRVAGGDAPGINVNQPHKWNGGSLAQYDISFTLFNILNNDDYIQNDKFIKRILMSTLHNQKSAILASPPALFTVNIPGVRYCPAAIINNIIVTNVGQINLMKFNGKLANVPDAFDITLNISELIQESRQILKASIDGSHEKVVAISDKEIKAQEILASGVDLLGHGAIGTATGVGALVAINQLAGNNL